MSNDETPAILSFSTSYEETDLEGNVLESYSSNCNDTSWLDAILESWGLDLAGMGYDGCYDPDGEGDGTS